MNKMLDCGQAEISNPDLKEGLINRKQRLEVQLKDINDAIEALERNPEVARILELVGRAGRY
jgi:chaperonin cofactor prefoldin